ncbi:hypothetical protein [Actinacidiphila rubida]|uniref:hypothetical protein n=1 Tax=Actinacidiphila rubida TaxID=310780 RepID=UPI00114CD0D8|nr:hypothetical protein [Actinacidiphila rubida]
MNDTVAVALITSLSTLSAAGVAGAATAWVTGRQLRHQSVLARQERAERRAADHREVCRGVYETFLSRADEAYRVLDEGWFAAPFTESGRWEAGFAARRALDEAYVRVRLAGPDDVAERGAEVVRGIGDEFRLHARLVAGGPDAAGSAAEREPSARTRALRVRADGSWEFVAAARRALTGEAADERPPAGRTASL